MEEEEEICRVCRSEGTLTQPLFHPCKCSGSIRYVHQECLTEWLRHSRKERCELCKHPFIFTLVFRQDMPDTLPPYLYLQQFRKKMGFIIYNSLRASLVFTVWLTLLPYFTVWIWRIYFHFGHLLSKQLVNIYQLKVDYEDQKDDWFEKYKSKMNSQSFISDCFEGQIITGVIVIVSVALFLLKEWVVQNLPTIDEAEHARAVNQLPPAILEPIFQDDIQLPDNLPASPVAPVEEEEDEWLNYISSNPKSIRAASMPPLSSTNPSSSQPSGSNREFYENEFRRSASMEPLFNTQQSEHETMMARGNPPYAPIVRNADAPMMNIQPIEEEPEEDMIQRQIEPEADDEEEDNQEDEENDDLGNFGDDIEGVMEAIGMQGSFWVLAQNATLMAVLVALVLFIVVGLPYVFGIISILSVGKEVAGFPVEFVALVHRHIGKITDPLIDPLLTAYFDYLWPTIVFCCELYLKPLLETCLGKSASLKLFSMFFSNSTSSHLPSADGLSHGGVDHFISLYNKSKPLVESMFNRYQGFAVGESSIDRFSCILVGYVTILFLTYIFLSRSKMLYTVFGANAKEVLREYFIILKLSMFITIELLVFPLVCGVVLDLSTLPLFEGATLMKRLVFLTTSPVSSIFIHWFLGTGFMFLFAVFVTLCRSIVRPGVMWFIRDPTDPQFHPLREIVERPVLFQYQKIGSSGLVYVLAIFLCIGGVIHTVNLAGSAILPLRWSISTPLSTIPIDLLTTQLILPAAIGYLQPKQVIKQWFINLIVFCCRQLCLSSFIFGERKPEEEGTLIYHTWSAWIQRAKPPYYPRGGDPFNIHGAEVSYVWNGKVLRVPSHDRVPVLPNRRMLVPVDPFIFEPLEETDRNLGHPASTAAGGDEANTTLVYSPPNFYKRILALVVSVWFVSTASLCAFAFVPLVLGRTIFQHRLKVEGNVHDIYSYTLGASLILFVWSVGLYFVRIVDDVHRQRTMQSKLKSLLNHIRRWLVKTFRWGFFLASFGLVLPLAFGAILELYFALPTRGLTKEPVELKIMPVWANGIAFMVVAHGLVHVLPENRWGRAITNTFQRGIGRMSIRLCFKNIVRPLAKFCIIAIFAPLILAYMDKRMTDSRSGEADYRKIEMDSVRFAYFVALIGSGFYYFIKIINGTERSWEGRIREENYLVGRILHNHGN